jgi:hypothetical protein
MSILGNAYSRNITCHAAVRRQPRIILALVFFVAVVRPWREASARSILVLELAVAGAFVELRAVRVVGDALHVEGAGSNLEATGAADFALRRGEGDGEGEEDRFEKHCECLRVGVCSRVECKESVVLFEFVLSGEEESKG